MQNWSVKLEHITTERFQSESMYIVESKNPKAGEWKSLDCDLN